jgi:4-amino-4-deoxy-L-arabinose transferase-like glycosyltransferase
MGVQAKPQRWSVWAGVAAAVLLGLAFILVWGLNMRRGLNHDEHQFVAGAALLARDGLLPYRDFPYFHVPTLSFVYAFLFQVNDYLLLTARVFSIVCSWLTLVLIFAAALGWLRHLPIWWRMGIGAATVVLLMTTPSFLHASGRAWNHDFPLLLTLLAAVGQVAWLKRSTPAGRQWWWPLLAGVLVGLAASARLTFAVAAAAFALSILLVIPWRTGRAWGAVGLFVVGMAAGALPALYMLAVAPEQFIFGNLTYAQLNTLFYRQAEAAGTAPDAAMTLSAKLVKTVEYVVTQPGNLLLVLLAGFALWRARRQVGKAPELLFLLLLIPCFLVGAYAPTPLQLQYIYLLFPLLALIFLAALAYDERPRLGAGLVTGAAIVSAILAGPRYVEGVQVAFDPAEWFPLKVHARGEYLGDLVGRRQVLTLAPIYALEGDAGIYPEFVAGPMGWRVASLMTPSQRQTMGLVGLDELEADLAAQPPRGIFTGLHDNDVEEEAPLLAYARAQGYVPIALPEEGTLWASPLATWGGRIRLGAADLPAEQVRPGSEILATMHLQAVQPITTNLNVLVRLVDAGGHEVARSEGWPWGRATSTWPLGEVWPDGHTLRIPAAAVPGPYRVEMNFYNPDTLELVDDPATVGYVVVGEENPENPAQPVRATFGDGITLAWADVPAEGWQPGATQTVDLTWLADTPERGRYTVFLHLIGPSGTPAAQGDQQPWQGAYPTDAWLVGVPATDQYQLALPEDLPSGEYALVVGLYDPATQQRLPLLRAGKPVGDSFTLNTIRVP